MIVSDCGDGLRLEIADFRVSGRQPVVRLRAR